MNWTAILILSAAWLITIAALFAERKERIALYGRAIKAETAIQAVQTVVQRNAAQHEPGVIDGHIRPFVEEAKSFEMTGHQKRMQVLLKFLKAHPGISVDAAEQAIERVLIEDAGGHGS